MKKTLTFALSALLSFISSMAEAGTFTLKGAATTNANAVPTLGEWGMFISALLIVVLATSMLKKEKTGSALAGLFLAIALPFAAFF